jgi:hypothetical protein
VLRASLSDQAGGRRGRAPGAPQHAQLGRPGVRAAAGVVAEEGALQRCARGRRRRRARRSRGQRRARQAVGQHLRGCARRPVRRRRGPGPALAVQGLGGAYARWQQACGMRWAAADSIAGCWRQGAHHPTQPHSSPCPPTLPQHCASCGAYSKRHSCTHAPGWPCGNRLRGSRPLPWPWWPRRRASLASRSGRRVSA